MKNKIIYGLSGLVSFAGAFYVLSSFFRGDDRNMDVIALAFNIALFVLPSIAGVAYLFLAMEKKTSNSLTLTSVVILALLIIGTLLSSYSNIYEENIVMVMFAVIIGVVLYLWSFVDLIRGITK